MNIQDIAMVCPQCGHLVSEHCKECERIDLRNILIATGPELAFVPCGCTLSRSQALLAAQRHAAAKNLWRMKRAANDLLRGSGVLTSDTARTLFMAITGYQFALRDCGIQRPRRSESK